MRMNDTMLMYWKFTKTLYELASYSYSRVSVAVMGRDVIDSYHMEICLAPTLYMRRDWSYSEDVCALSKCTYIFKIKL